MLKVNDRSFFPSYLVSHTRVHQEMHAKATQELDDESSCVHCNVSITEKQADTFYSCISKA